MIPIIPVEPNRGSNRPNRTAARRPLRAATSHIVSRQLQAVDCDEGGGIVMREIAVGLCAARGLLSLLSRNSHIEIDNQAILHSLFWHIFMSDSTTQMKRVTFFDSMSYWIEIGYHGVDTSYSLPILLPHRPALYQWFKHSVASIMSSSSLFRLGDVGHHRPSLETDRNNNKSKNK
jgi:hypothetical protein